MTSTLTKPAPKDASMTATPPLRELMIHLTARCNLACPYCFVDHTTRRMSAQTARKVVDWFFDDRISGEKTPLAMNFFGGEPFLELDRIEQIIELASERSRERGKAIQFSATTNGTIASPRVERIVRGARMSLLLSMDGGPDAMRSRPFVSGRSSYALVARNLPKLTDWARSVIVRMTFHPASLDLVGNVKHLLELGARCIAIAPVFEADWQSHEPALVEAYEALADWYIQHARRGVIIPVVHTHMALSQYHASLQGAPRPARPCGVGHNLMGVDPDGNVMPCHRFLYRKQDWLGTVDQPVHHEKRKLYTSLNSRNLLGCENCPAKPVCGGGCRLVALNAGLSLDGTYSNYCITMRAHASAAFRIYRTLIGEGNAAFAEALRAPRMPTGSIAELIMQ